MGEPDLKSYRRRQLSLDQSNLGRAMNSLSSLKNRWEDKTAEIDTTVVFLRELMTLLTEEGHIGYIPKKPKPKLIEVKEETKEEIDRLAKIEKIKLEIKKLEEI